MRNISTVLLLIFTASIYSYSQNDTYLYSKGKRAFLKKEYDFLFVNLKEGYEISDIEQEFPDLEDKIISYGTLNLKNYIQDEKKNRINTWLTINVLENRNLVEHIKKSLKVSYCENFYSNDDGIFRITNYIYVEVNNDKGYSLLKEIATNNKVNIIGKSKTLKDYYLLSGISTRSAEITDYFSPFIKK